MKIMLVGSEAIPFSKTGGLADVLGSLPQALAEEGHEVVLVLPKHAVTKSKVHDVLKTVKETSVKVHENLQYCGFQYLKHHNVNVYFVDNEYYFGNRPNLYGDYDDGERYSFFCHAALTLIQERLFVPDVIHANDWPTGLIPYLLKLAPQYQSLSHIKTVYTIHNIAYQGRFGKDLMPYLNAPYTDAIEFDDLINYLKAGIMTAAKITTVSPTYAKELQHAYFSYGLDGVLRLREDDFVGIVNGIDTHEFNPQYDPYIAHPYTLRSVLKGKRDNKNALLKQMGLAPTPKPIVGMISRLTEAKGFPLLEQSIEPFLKEDRMRLIILGSGDETIASHLRYLQTQYPQQVAISFGYNEALARQIYAGSDLFLMPSRFEPCGLAQLISLQYGTLPIVRKTGGLRDTIEPFNRFTQEGHGFAFEHYMGSDMAHALNEALETFADKEVFKKLIKRAMNLDFSWKQSALSYLELYQS
jgi:starch synthase